MAGTGRLSGAARVAQDLRNGKGKRENGEHFMEYGNEGGEPELQSRYSVRAVATQALAEFTTARASTRAPNSSTAGRALGPSRYVI